MSNCTNHNINDTISNNDNDSDKIHSIFVHPDNTRLVTIAAHVDHGKTTLADNLIESNGLISERSAGTLRYLDSDPEEQRRGITMRASAIGLSHRYMATTTATSVTSTATKAPSTLSRLCTRIRICILHIH